MPNLNLSQTITQTFNLMTESVTKPSGAYPEIFRGRGFEIYGQENLGGVLGFFSLKTLAN